jgi:RNA polymerase sigma factor (sigma-70 family)
VRELSDGHDFDVIWRDAAPALWRAVLVYAGGHKEVADDAVAEAFARVIERNGEVREPVPYLYRVAFRIAARELSQMARQTEQEDASVIDTIEDVDLLRALARLSPTQRGAVYLHYQRDLPIREVAGILGTSGPAIRVHLMRGRRRLADLLGEDPR